MRLRQSGLLLVTALLAACQVSAPAVPKGSRAPGSPGASPQASAKPNGRATSGPAAGRSAAPLAMLAPLGQASVKLTGSLRVDPAYLVAAGAGNILSHNGGQIVAAGGLNMIAAGAGGLVAAGAGNIVAAGAGNVVAVTGSQIVAAGGLNMIAAGGGQIVAAGGLNMIAAGAGNLVGADGASLVGADGASLVGADGASYSLAQAGAAPARELPAAGMLVSVVSLATRQYLPLGRTPDGKDDVYAVYSDAAGKFDLSVPKGEEGNVMVVASVPGQRVAGTIYNAITKPTEALVVDEDTATVTRYLRGALVGRLADIIAAKDTAEADELIDVESSIAPAAKEQLRLVLARMQALAAQVDGFSRSAGDPALHALQAHAIAQAIVDASFSRVDLREVRINEAIAIGWQKPYWRVELPNAEDADRVLPLLLRCFGELRARTEQAMPLQNGVYKRLDATFFQRVAVGSEPTGWFPNQKSVNDWVVDVLDRYPSGPYEIGKPAQMGDFLVDRYMAVNRPYIYEPLVTAYMLLDPAAAGYAKTPTMWNGLSADDLTRANLILAQINARFPALAMTPADATFGGEIREHSSRYAHTLDAIGFTMFVEVGFAVAASDGPAAQAVEAALAGLVLPAALSAAGG